MAEQKEAGAEKPGYFARRRERKEAKKAAAQAPPPPKAPAAPLKPAARPAAGPPKPAPPAAPPARVSLESLPEVEKRIDRMSATERRQNLLERYEQRYGERLELPDVFVSIEDEKKAEAAAAADGMAAGAGAIDEGKLATVTGLAPPKPSAPAPKPPAPAPAKPGLFGARPVPPPAARPGAPAPPRPAAPLAAAPRPAQPKMPSPVNRTSFWKYLWPYWRLPMRNYAKYYWPDKGGIQAAFTVIDIPIWILLFIPRIGLCPAGYFLEQRKKKAAAAVEPEAVVTAN